MNVEEQLRQSLDDAAHRLPERPGDVAAALEKGDRRRRRARAGAVAAGVAMVAVVAVGVTTMPWPSSVPVQIDSAEHGPAHDSPTIVGDPVLDMTGGAGWRVAVSPGEDGRWCVTAERGEVEAPVGGPCQELRAPAGHDAGEQLTVAGSTADDGVMGLLFGSADMAADEVRVTFEDGSRRTATSATGGPLPFKVWAISFDEPVPVSVEALASGRVIASLHLDDLAQGPDAASDADTAPSAR